LYALTLMARLVTLVKMSVWPSGGALATACIAMIVAAPGRFSTITGCPSGGERPAAIARASRSPGPPGAKGEMIFTALAG